MMYVIHFITTLVTEVSEISNQNVFSVLHKLFNKKN